MYFCPHEVVTCAQQRLEGARIFDIWLVLDANWFVKPKNDLRSVRLPGVGKVDMAAVMSLLMEYPSGVSLNLSLCSAGAGWG